MRKTTEQRFWEKVNKTDGRWLWTGSKLPKSGHGRFHAPEVGNYAHRYSWMLHFGAIPIGLEVCHKCDIGSCVNPDCLFLGTHAENMADRDRKGRGYGGDRHHSQKLTAEQVRCIRNDTESTRKLARRYGVSPTAIAKIIRREVWKHI